MKESRFWAPVIISLAVMPFCCCLSWTSIGPEGRGDLFWPEILFPFAMLPFLIGSRSVLFLPLAILQFPAYGLILGFANTKRILLRVALLLMAVHAFASGFIYVRYYYSSERLFKAVHNGDLATVKGMLQM